ncbi:endonuclease/exonuclease/phosphatase family protein [Metabacillus iocasae]|uniref:Maltose 6'-phosphate phosphatase n=1 Tax=Priestia iocasae TaxID=2291674 RepID=A0ABS2QZH8_9BACI|nr:endonuclease/exonuclease/phosphatase family protein [Metabacillus iocasae]MBM7704131.1 maltose 6'-phosphate phosphatase [Metabacillus iocasae]
MKLLTLNCHSWQEENQLEKIQSLAETIKEKAYDVIALQEVSQLIEKPVVYDNVKEGNYALVLIEELKKLGVDDYSLIWDFAHIGYDIYEEGLAVLTKHPLIESHSFFISQSKDTDFWKTRRIVGATVAHNDQEISFYSCHLGWWNDDEEPFKEQIDALLAHVPKDKPFFLMGDFNNNAFIRNEGYDYLMSQNVYDTYELAEEKDRGITVKGKIAGWDQNQQDLRIDLILSSEEVAVATSAVIFNGTNKPIVSDHFGVEVEIKR